MSNNGDLTVSLTLTGDNKQLVNAVQESRDEIDRLGASSSKTSMLASQLSGVMGGQAEEIAKSTGQVQKLLDRYDPLSAKLQKLKSDFETLSSAASRGHIAPVDDSRVDSVYSKIKSEISATEAAMSGIGPAAGAAFGEMAAGAEKGIFATAQARRELIVLGHEAMMGNFSRMPGSFMVLGERASAAGISLIGLAAPILAAAAAAFALAKAFSDGQAEMHAMNRAMVATGDYAGVTRGQMRELAQSMADSSNMTIGQTKEIVTQLVASGRIGSAALQSITSLTSDFASVTGQSVAKVGPQLVKLFEDPAKGAQQLNQSMHFLSASELEHIASLQRMGESEKAQLELADQLKNKISGEAESLGGLGGMLDSVKKSASEMWDSLMAVGRPDTLEEKIAAAQEQLASAYKWHMPWNTVADSQSHLSVLEEMKVKQDAMAKQKADAAAANERSNAAARYMQSTSAYKIRALEQQKAAFDQNVQVDGSSYTPEMKAQADANFEKQIASLRQKSGGSDRSRAALVKAEQDAAYKAQHESLLRQQEDLDRSLKGQLISYQDYYSKKQALEQQDAQLKIKGIQFDIAAAEKSVSTAPTQDARYQAQARLVTLQGELSKATEDYGRIAPKVAQEATQAYKKLDDTVQAAKTHLLSLQGKTADSEILSLHQKYDDTIAQLKKNGNTQGVSIMTELFNTSVADARLKEIEAQFNATLSHMADEERRISINQQAGLITKFEARSQLKDLHSNTAPKLQKDLKPLDAMDLGSLNSAQMKQVDQLRLKIEQVNGSVSDLNRTFEYGASNALGDYLDKITNAALQSNQVVTDSFKGMENALTNFVEHGKLNFDQLTTTIVNDLIRMEVQQNIMAPLTSMAQGANFSGLFSSILGGSSSTSTNQPDAATMANFGSTQQSSSMALLNVGGYHSGGNPAVDGPTFTRYVHPAYFEHAPRFHTGIGPGEIPAIIQPSESVLTPGQMRQLAPVSALQQVTTGGVTVNIYGAPSTPQVQTSQTSNGMQIDVLFEQVDNYIASGIKTGNGSTALAISQTYGADRSAGAYR